MTTGLTAFVLTTEQVLAQEQYWLTAIDRQLGALVEHAVAHAELHRIVYNSANAKALELCKESNQRVIELMVELVLANAESAAADLDSELACRMIYHAADGLLDDLIARRTEIDPVHATECVLKVAHAILPA